MKIVSRRNNLYFFSEKNAFSFQQGLISVGRACLRKSKHRHLETFLMKIKIFIRKELLATRSKNAENI
jgi:hypothetical protein